MTTKCISANIWEILMSRLGAHLPIGVYLHRILEKVALQWSKLLSCESLPVFFSHLIHSPHTFQILWLLEQFIYHPQMLGPQWHSVSIDLHIHIGNDRNSKNKENLPLEWKRSNMFRFTTGKWCFSEEGETEEKCTSMSSRYSWPTNFN